jgi:hypothetical protein
MGSGSSGPTPYGPLWNELAAGAVWLGHDALSALLLTKLLIVAASLGSAAVIYVALGRLRPELRLAGTLAYLWNPLIIIEFAAEGHNDALMVLPVVAGLLATLASRPATSIVISALGVVTKYVPLMFVPAQLVFLARAGRLRRLALIGSVVGGGLIALGIVAVTYAPFWTGPSTFTTLLRAGEVSAPRVSSSLRLALFALFLLVWTSRVSNPESLVRVCAEIALVYALLGSASYWPWYATLPLALLVLWPDSRGFALILVLAVCGELDAPGPLIEKYNAATAELVAWANRASRLIPLALYAWLLGVELRQRVLAHRWRKASAG